MSQNNVQNRADSFVKQGVALLVSVTIVALLSLSGAAVTSPQIGSWYATLTKPVWTPPDWLFGPVWGLLYLMMAFAAWLVWRVRHNTDVKRGLLLYAIQLILNGFWSWLFFQWHLVGAALIDTVLLLFIIALAMRSFWRSHPLAGILLLPYLLWVAFATVLNASIWKLN
jgi:tryptophan-rich sensory protein